MGSSAEILHKEATAAAAAAASSGGAPMLHPGKGAAGSGSDSGSSGETLQEKAAAASNGGAPTTHPGKPAVGRGSSVGEVPEKKTTASSGGSAALGALHGNTSAHDCEESDAKYSTKKESTVSTAEIPHEHCTEDGPDTCSSEEMLHEHPAKESDTAKEDIQDSDSNKIAHIKDESIQEGELLIQEAELFIQKLNDLGKGEDISGEEFLAYFEQLAPDPASIDLAVKLEDEELDKQQNRHALLRLRYYKHKFSQQTSEDELLAKLKEKHNPRFPHESEDDCTEEFLEEEEEDELYYEKLKEDRHLSRLHKSEDDCSDEFLEEEGFFRCFEEAKAFDWFFHRDYTGCSSLNDYQCLVLKNYGGTEYTRWSEYHEYLHSYEIEKEYVMYCEELSKQLKWMEDYVHIDQTSVKWSKISSRGAYQAIKIAATSFHKITLALAYNGYFECKEDMVYDYTFYKEVEGVYFEIWRRVTHRKKSFKDALEEVYNLNKFLSRQCLMKAALESDDTMKKMEEEFRTCTEAIKPEVEDKAQELIAEAVRKLVKEPKSYDEYIRKKMRIARIIGILDSDDEE